MATTSLIVYPLLPMAFAEEWDPEEAEGEEATPGIEEEFDSEFGDDDDD